LIEKRYNSNFSDSLDFNINYDIIKNANRLQIKTVCVF